MTRIWAKGLAGCVGALLWISCSSGDGSGADPGHIEGSVQHPFSESNCGGCLQVTCAEAIARCAADPECGAHLQCLYDCPTDDTGNVDTACEAACPVGTGSVAEAALSELHECRTVGKGYGCSACRASAAWILDQNCPPTAEENPCWACEDTHCCHSYGAYASSPEAQAFKECMVDCIGTGQDGCEASCNALHPDGLALWAQRMACVLVFCADSDACNDVPLSECERCINASCALEFVEMLSDAFGYLLWACTADCPDDACWEQCQDAYPLAVHLLDGFLGCSLAHCSSECS